MLDCDVPKGLLIRLRGCKKKKKKKKIKGFDGTGIQNLSSPQKKRKKKRKKKKRKIYEICLDIWNLNITKFIIT